MVAKSKEARISSSEQAAKEALCGTVDLEFIGSKDELAETRTVSSRGRLRDQLSNDVEAFLAKGGAINEVAPEVTADPPRKPESNYGSRSI